MKTQQSTEKSSKHKVHYFCAYQQVVSTSYLFFILSSFYLLKICANSPFFIRPHHLRSTPNPRPGHAQERVIPCTPQPLTTPSPPLSLSTDHRASRDKYYISPSSASKKISLYTSFPPTLVILHCRRWHWHLWWPPIVAYMLSLLLIYSNLSIPHLVYIGANHSKSLKTESNHSPSLRIIRHDNY